MNDEGTMFYKHRNREKAEKAEPNNSNWELLYETKELKKSPEDIQRKEKHHECEGSTKRRVTFELFVPESNS